MWYSGLSDYDITKYEHDYDIEHLVDGYMGDNAFVPWESRIASNLSATRYNPTTLPKEYSEMGVNKAHYKYATDIENQDYYKNFEKILFDNNGNLTKYGEAWAKLTDSLLPENSLSRIFDENGNLRKSWTITGKDAHDRNINKTYTNIRDYVQAIRNDQIIGGRHNVFLNKGKRYFYRDEQGNKHYVDPTVVKDYIVSNNPAESNWNEDKTVWWDDYELTGKKNVSNTNTGDTPNNEIQQDGPGYISRLISTLSLKTPQDYSTLYDILSKIGEDSWKYQNDNNNNKSFILKISPAFPDLLGASRLWASLRNNEKVYKTGLDALKPVLKDTFERYSPVTGAFSEMQLKNKQAANVLSQANKPFTSDASLNTARMALAQNIANLLLSEGFLADDREIKRTKAEALARVEDNMQRRSEVANFNRASINKNNLERALLKNNKLDSDWLSIDNFLSGIESRLREKTTKTENSANDFYNKVEANRALNMYDKYKNEALLASKEWLSKLPPGTDITLWPEYPVYQEKLKEAWERVLDLLQKQYSKRNGLYYEPLYTDESTELFFNRGWNGRLISHKQQGGSFKFSVFKPVAGGGSGTMKLSSGSTSSSNDLKQSDDDSDKGKLTEKDLFLMLKELKGLPNDVNNLVGLLMTSINNAKALGTYSIQDIANTYLSSLGKLANISYNKELFDETLKESRANGSLNDIAITVDGSTLVMDKNNKILAVSPKDWSKVKNSDKYKPLTNSNLLWLRANRPEYINDTKILQIVENGIGLDTIHKMIKDRFHEIGKNKSSNEVFISKDAAKGHEIIEQMLQYGPEGFYKIKTELERSDLNSILATLDYIYDTLPKNAKDRLAFETSDGKLKSVKQIIGSMIFGSLESTTNYSAQYISSTNKKSNSGSGTSDSDELNIVDKFLAGMGDKENFIINLGSTTSFVVKSNTLPLVKMNSDYLGANSTLLQVTEGLFDAVLDTRSVTMGGELIDPVFFDKVLLTDGKISSIDFPFVELDGIIKPDLSLETIAKKEAVEGKIRAKGINTNDIEQVRKNISVINQMYESEGLPPAYNPDGSLRTENYKRFGVINGRTSNKALLMELSANNPLLLEESNGNVIQIYKSTVKEDNWDDNNFLWNGVDHLYKGTIWIPLKVNYLSAGAKDKISASEAIWLEQQDQAIATRQSLNLGRLLSN